MAFGAIYLLVFSFKGKRGLVVIEFIQNGVRRKRLLYVALLTICTEVRIMGVSVAAVAIAGRHPCKPLECLAVLRFLFMTLDARYSLVLSPKGIIRFIVVKISCR